MSNGNGWMPLHVGDYLADTMELDGAQHGAYLLLLMHYWRTGPLTTDDAKLAQIARTDIRIWKKSVGPVVKAFFSEVDGRLHQKRADLELAKAAECHQRTSERRQQDNDRLKAWRARQGQDNPPSQSGSNSKDPPVETNETRFNGVSPSVSERVTKRSGNADETRLTCTSQVQPVQEERKEVIKIPFLGEETRARGSREQVSVPDGLAELLDAAGIEPPPPLPEEVPNLIEILDAREADRQKLDKAGAVGAQVRRVARATTMRIPYGEVRSIDAQLAALQPQPQVVGADASMGLKWAPAEPVRSIEEQRAALLAGCSPEQIAKAQRYAARHAA